MFWEDYIRQDDYKKVVEENKRLKEILRVTKECLRECNMGDIARMIEEKE
jgi:hypothetical protein